MADLKGQYSLGEHKLTFNVNTFCDLEDEFEAQDVNAVLEVINSLQERPSMKTIRSIFYVALKQEHPEITLQEAGTIIQSVGLDKAAEALGEAVSQAFPAADEGDQGEVGNAKKGSAGTG